MFSPLCFTLRETIYTQNLFSLNSETIGYLSKPKRGNVISKIFFVCGRQETSRPEQKAKRRAVTAKAARKLMRKKKNQRQREKRKTSDTYMAKVIYHSGMLHWI